jgi:hypothetical protein
VNGERRVLDHALRAADLLGPVFPCAPRSKEPFARLAPHGCYSATRSPERIRSWFRAGSTLNLALACGSGLLALDIDPRNQGDETFARLEREHGPLPPTPRQVTGGGGLHFLLRGPAGVVLRNGAIAPGVEVKADGGYIVIAPSVHPSGSAYRWDLGALPSETPIADAPAWLIDAARERERRPYGPATGPAVHSFLGIAFAAAGMLGSRTGAQGAVAVRCPWLHEHSDGRGDGHDLSTVILPPNQRARLGSFRCAHAHCSQRPTGAALAALPTAALLTAARALPGLAPLAARWVGEREDACP